MQTLVQSVIQALTSWATEQFDLTPAVAATVARKLIYDHVIENASPLASILRAELHLQKVGADATVAIAGGQKKLRRFPPAPPR